MFIHKVVSLPKTVGRDRCISLEALGCLGVLACRDSAVIDLTDTKKLFPVETEKSVFAALENLRQAGYLKRMENGDFVLPLEVSFGE